MVRFKFLTGDVNWKEYGGKFVSQRLNNGEFDFWFVLEIINYEDACGTTDPRYAVQLTAVAPSQVSEKKRQQALDSWGLDPEWWQSFLEQQGDLAWVEVLSSYGIEAVVWQDEGNNLAQLMKAARKEAQKASMLLGFFLDRHQNAIGSDGWDFLRGEVLAGIGIHD